MGLIKRNHLEEKGEIVIEEAAPLPPRREAAAITPTADIKYKPEDIPKAKSEAQKIIERAQAEAESIRNEAREEGRQEGHEEAEQKINEALTTLNEAVKERKKIIQDSEGEILRLSLKIAEKIIHSEVSLHPDVSLNIVAEAIGRISDREQIIIKVNREDAEYIKRYKDRLANMLDGVKSFSIIEDANIEPGGCVIETNLGFIDSRIATKLKSIEESLTKQNSSEDDK
ncbi:MAG: FliH/SctL family protein [bacterium]